MPACPMIQTVRWSTASLYAAAKLSSREEVDELSRVMVKEDLLGRLETADNEFATSRILAALGNTKDRTLVPVIEKHVSSDSIVARTSSLDAIASIGGHEESAYWLDQLANEENETVSNAIGRRLSQQEPAKITPHRSAASYRYTPR